MILNVERINCHNVIESALAILGNDAKEKRSSMSTDLCATNAWIQADPSRLQQVLLNRTRFSFRVDF